MARKKAEETRVPEVNQDPYAEQKKTLEDCERILHEFYKCAIIRPTGFGKTFLLTSLINRYSKVLYLYPAQVIRNTVVDTYYNSMYSDELEDYIDENGDVIDPETIDALKEISKIENCDLMTYSKLIRLANEDIEAMDYDLIIMDECHRIGGRRTKYAVEVLMRSHTDTRFVGATATPTRMDNFDVVSYFFDDRCTYTYTLFNAIEDGLLQKPNYCFCTENPRKDLEDAAKEACEDVKDPEIVKILDRHAFEISKLNGMPHIIETVCKDYVENTSYMKFIVFFTSIKHMKDRFDDVKEWFHEAYPKHKIVEHRISSANKTEASNVDLLDDILPQSKTIDLIACIDMLNVGYHVNNLTGIIMYRKTQSSTIFIQQLGRALSAGANNSAIVFDVVDNLHVKAAYNIKQIPKRTSPNKTTTLISANSNLDKTIVDEIDGKTLVENPIALRIDRNGVVWNTDDENEAPIKTDLHLDKKTGRIVDAHGNVTNKMIVPGTDQVVDMCDVSKNNCNQFDDKCINMVGYMATYREIIAKAVAEPLTQRCKYALELHFRSWCYANNIPYPISDSELTAMYNKTKNEFYKDFLRIIRINKIPYNLQDAQALLQIGNGDGQVPLSICASARNVSIEQILREFNIPNELTDNRKAV